MDLVLVGRTVVSVLFGLAGFAAAGFSLYLVLLAVASIFHRSGSRSDRPHHQLAVLVPAHDEAELLGRCLDSLLDQSYPRWLRRVIVIADNCTDATAEIAVAHGAEVMVRVDPEHPGKGQALRWAMDRLLQEPRPLDAVVVVDADSVADQNLLAELEAGLQRGQEVVQGNYLVLREDSGPRSALAAAAFLLFHQVRPSGRSWLGLPVSLVGNGMLFSRRVMSNHPWNAFSGVEDLEYAINLRLAGVRPGFALGARVHGPMPASRRGARTQRARWEGGRFHVIRTKLPELLAGGLRQRRWDLLDAAFDLAVLPLGLLILVTVAGAVAAGGLVMLRLAQPVVLLPWALALAALPAYVLIGLRSAGAPAGAYLALFGAPWFLVRKLGLYVRLSRGFNALGWERTQRPGEQAREEASRLEVAGVPVDPVDAGQALDRMVAAFGGPELMQVCTVNLDFLVQAQRDPEVREIFNRSHLNVADGAPVLWLGRLLGRRLPERVAGADLVPLLMAAAAERGARVFLLGGEDGAAAEAAQQLQQRHPGLMVASYEPPRASLAEIDDEEILNRVAEFRADILLVALGHPKQEKWIHRNRDRLAVSVAMGVGCCLDLMAGRVRRAPRWMRLSGLEWLFRLAQEPRRLFVRYLTDAGWLLRMMATAVSQRLAVRRVETG